MFIFTPMDIEHAQSICSWQYPPPYDIYNWQPWSDILTHSFEFGDPQIRAEQYIVVMKQDLTMIGYAQLFPMLGVTRLGFGMHPEYCGLGNGASFVQEIALEARRRLPQNEIDLEVLTWNLRAYKAYERAGFVHTDTYERPTPTGIQAFHCMVFNE